MKTPSLEFPALSGIVSAASALFIVAGGAWSLAYWTTFGIEPFQYSTLTALVAGAMQSLFLLSFLTFSLLLAPLLARHTILSDVYLDHLRKYDLERSLLSFQAELDENTRSLERSENRLQRLEDMEVGTIRPDLEEQLLSHRNLKDSLTQKIKTTKRKVDKIALEKNEVVKEFNAKYRKIWFWGLANITIFSVLLGLGYKFSHVHIFQVAGVIILVHLSVLVDFNLSKSEPFRHSKDRLLIYAAVIMVGVAVISYLSGNIEASKIYKDDYRVWLVSEGIENPQVLVGIISEYVILYDACAREVEIHERANVLPYRVIMPEQIVLQCAVEG